MAEGRRSEEEAERGGEVICLHSAALTGSKVIKYERQKQRLLSSLSQLVATIGRRRRRTADSSQGSPCDSCLSVTDRTSPDTLEGGGGGGGCSSVDRKDESAWLTA